MGTENEILVNDNPKSSFSESIKTIRTNLKFASIDNKIKSILITSPEPGDGKSFITANLATAFAQENKKILIVDADLRKGRQNRIFNLINDKNGGYSNLIMNIDEENLNYNNYIQHTHIRGVDLLTTGVLPPAPIELLSSANNKKTIEALEEKYDYVIFDCPPVLGLNDSIVMSKLMDANIIVVSKKKTKIEDLAEVKRIYEKANSKITGVVLNKVEQKTSSYYGYYGYYGE